MQDVDLHVHTKSQLAFLVKRKIKIRNSFFNKNFDSKRVLVSYGVQTRIWLIINVIDFVNNYFCYY